MSTQQNRTIEVHPEFRSQDLRVKLNPRFEEVLRHFKSLPRLRLLCYFDNENPEWLQRQYGEFAAIHTPVIGGGAWPQYVEHFFFDSNWDFAFDNLIYVPGTKYIEEKVSFVIVLAHEMQHFVQWGNSRKVLEANNLLYQHLASFDPMTQLKPWGLPHNREALIVAIRAAQAVCGSEVVKQFVDAQIRDGRERNNLSKTQMWEWALSILRSTPPYDLRGETDFLVQKYKTDLLKLGSQIDFSAREWWAETPQNRKD